MHKIYKHVKKKWTIGDDVMLDTTLVKLTDLRLTIFSSLTFIGEQEQLKKLSDNFRIQKNVFGQGLLTLTERVKRTMIFLT